ncbi:MAG: hypothetical protein EYC70_03455 [Planctomycetota bacterium]|nr:MAG: hypothetical protein EYC70_03455 [Planctomycetota bacterium]
MDASTALGTLSRALAAAVLVAATAPARQAPVPPWSDLEPAIAAADWIVLAKVTASRTLEPLGLQVEVLVEESLLGDARAGRTLRYLSDNRSVVKPGDRQLLFLGKPQPDGLHAQLRQRVGARDRHQEAKIDWLRAVLRLRAVAARARGGAFVRFYAEALESASDWRRERALLELERLRRERPEELHALLEPEVPERGAAAAGAPALRKRLEELAQWLRAPLPKPAPARPQ